MPSYRGRFAPTPSGPLHLGSLTTALGSFLAARAAGGQWLLRIDDLDRERVDPDAESAILLQLDAHGLHWDGPLRRQSEHLESYREALQALQRKGRLYACTCTRAQLARDSLAGPDDPVYAGTCRGRALTQNGAALRIEVPDQTLWIEDVAAGRISRRLVQDIGDFIVRRRDGQIAYQLACAVDETAQCITEVVRGADLLGSSFKQVHLLRQLGLPVPRYHHLPLVMDTQGHKLSKQNHARPIAPDQALLNLIWALRFLGQDLPPRAEWSTVPGLLDHAIRHWRPPEHALAMQQST